MCYRRRPHFRRPFQSGGDRRAGGGQAFPLEQRAGVHRRAGAGSHRGQRRACTPSPAASPGSITGGFAANGFGDHSPGGYSMESAILAEAVLTFMFLMIILGATDKRAPAGFAPIAIGLGLTLIHLVGIPVTNLSVNPARSTGPAVIVGGWAIAATLAVLGGADRRRRPSPVWPIPGWRPRKHHRVSRRARSPIDAGRPRSRERSRSTVTSPRRACRPDRSYPIRSSRRRCPARSGRRSAAHLP